MKKLLLVAFLCASIVSFSQHQVFELMERTDLRIQEIETIANRYFDSAGTGRGTGYKQFQRWLYERKFHVDENGYFISPQEEWNRYLATRGNMTNATNAGSWTPLGPNGWTYTSGWNPGTGRLSALAIHPANENIIYVGSPGGGLWKSTNAGATWISLTDQNATWMSVFALAIDPNNQNVVYMGTSTGLLLKSTDAGMNWNNTGAGPTGTIRKVLIHPTNSNIVFACATNGIFRSTNAGTSWTQVHTTSKEDIEFKPNDPNIMIASGNNVARSTDMGLTWTVLTAAEGITNTGRTLVSVSPANPDIVYAVQASGSLFGRMYRSTNGGATFVTTVVGSPGSGTNYFGYNTDGTGTSGQATYDMAMDVSPVNADEVYIAGIICFRSTNGGVSFTAQTAWSYPNSTGYNHADVHGLFWVNSTLYSISDGGIYKSVDQGDNWIDLSPGLGIRQFYRIAQSPTNTNVITGGAQDNGSVTRQAGGNWVDWLGADGMEGLVSPTNHLKLWGTSQNGSIYRSTNGGNSYSSLPRPSAGNWVTPIEIHPTDENILYGGWTGVYKSINGGTSWTNIGTGTITSLVTDIAIAPSSPTTIYASIGATLYVTTNDGANWTTRSAPASINDICVDPDNPSKIWIACNSATNRVFVSTDGGATFTNISLNLPSIVARTIRVDNNPNRNIYVGMNIGVFHKNESAGSWTDFSDNLPMVAVNELEILPASNLLRVATYGRGVWESPLAPPPAGFAFDNPSPVTAGCPGPSTLSITLGTSSLSGFSNPITLSASGAPAGTSVSFGTNPVAPGNSSVVTLNSTNTLAPGTYTITITGTATGASTQTRDLVFVITAGTGPVINTQPSSQTVCSGQTTSFSVSATGAVTYLWQTSADCNVWANVSDGSVYSGSTSATLTILSPTPAMSGYSYRVQVFGQCGTTISSPCATLTVTGTPNITAHPQDVSTCAGTPVTLCVTATGSGLLYQWESSPSCAGPWTNVAGATSNCLTITPTGNTAYRCRVYTAGCSASVSNCATVTVNAPATILAHPSDAIRCAGGTATFSAAAAGPSLTYQWQVSTDGGNSFANISGATSPNFTIAPVTAAMNANRYRLQVTSNGCAVVHSNAARLTAHALPAVTLSLAGQAFLLPGQLATLTASVTPGGGTVVNTTWTLNGNTFNPGGNVYSADVEHTGTYLVSASETWADGSVCQSQSLPVTVGVQASSRLFIFPSPNDGRFTVSYYNSEAGTAQRSITVYDSKGALVHREKFTINGPYTLLNIDITPAQRGSYTVVVHDATGKKLAQGIIVVH